MAVIQVSNGPFTIVSVDRLNGGWKCSCGETYPASCSFEDEIEAAVIHVDHQCKWRTIKSESGN